MEFPTQVMSLNPNHNTDVADYRCFSTRLQLYTKVKCNPELIAAVDAVQIILSAMHVMEDIGLHMKKQ